MAYKEYVLHRTRSPERFLFLQYSRKLPARREKNAATAFAAHGTAICRVGVPQWRRPCRSCDLSCDDAVEQFSKVRTALHTLHSV